MLLFSSECISKMRCVLEDPSRERTKTSLSFKHLNGRTTEPRVQLDCALAKDKQYVAKAKKLKRLEAKVISSVKFSLLFVVRYWNMVMRSLILITDELNCVFFPFSLSPIKLI